MKQIYVNSYALPLCQKAEQVKIRSVIVLETDLCTYHEPEAYIQEMFAKNDFLHSATVVKTGDYEKLAYNRNDAISARNINQKSHNIVFGKHAEIVFLGQINQCTDHFNSIKEFSAYLSDHPYAKFTEQLALHY